MYIPHTSTKIFIALFIASYLVFLLRKIRKDGLDLYDFLFLLTIAVVPGVFVFLPGWAMRLSHFLGVEFPFVVMFGLLIFILFAQVHHMLIDSHKSRGRIIELTQQMAYLEHKLRTRDVSDVEKG